MFDRPEDIRLADGREVDGAGFVLAMAAQLVGEGLADPARIHLSGFGDGAAMSFRLLCTAGAPFAAAAAGAGTMLREHRDKCAAEAPLPVMVIAGTRDEFLSCDGSLSPEGRELSVPETMEHFRQLNRCTGRENSLPEDRDDWDESRVVEMRWTGCTAGNAVSLLKVSGGGHNWPSFEPIPRKQRERTGPPPRRPHGSRPHLRIPEARLTPWAAVAADAAMPQAGSGGSLETAKPTVDPDQ